METDCTTKDRDEDVLFLRIDGGWIRYKGSTSLRKIYYRFHEASRNSKASVYIYEYEGRRVDGAMFPSDFYRHLKCSSMDGIPTYALPSRIILKRKQCSWVKLGNGSGKVCTFCGHKE